MNLAAFWILLGLLQADPGALMNSGQFMALVSQAEKQAAAPVADASPLPSTSPAVVWTDPPSGAPVTAPIASPSPSPSIAPHRHHHRRHPSPSPSADSSPLAQPTPTPWAVPSVWNYASPTPATSPMASASPTANPVQPVTSGCPGPGQYPDFSACFSANTPFHHTVASLMGAGARVLSQTIAAHYWAQGVASSGFGQSGGVGPLYTVSTGDPGYTFSCPAWGACNASGMTVHYPQGAYPETGTDHHLNSFDMVYLKGEVDGWGGDGNPSQACQINGSVTCSWGGFYPFSGNGLAQGANTGDAGGYAFGLMDISASDLIRGRIDHAMGIEESCLDDGGVYPSLVGRKTDAPCPGNLEPNAVYGDLIHLKASVNVASLGGSAQCQIVLQALQTYGAYTADNTGKWGIYLNFEYPNAYKSNPWTLLYAGMIQGGDGSGSSPGNCLSRVPAGDIEVIQISPNLPPLGPSGAES